MFDMLNLYFHPDLAEGFLRAIKKAYLYITTEDSMDVAKALKPSFDTTSLESLASAVEKYIEIDVWSPSPAMTNPENSPTEPT